MSNGAAAATRMAEKNNSITETVKGMSRKLLAFIRRRVASLEDAEDILQEVFFQFAGKSESVEEAGSWLYRVTRNKITDSYRKKKLPLADDLFENEEDAGDWKDVLFTDDADAETAQMRNLFWETLHDALDELPAEQREAFLLNELGGVSFKEIAVQTGVSVATLISRKRYAVLHLRERLETLKNELLIY